jgi:hypothetical protein
MSNAQDDDAEPWASPEIQQNYETALGRFIVAFNAVDNLLSQIVETVLRHLGRDDLIKEGLDRSPLNLRLQFLDLLKHSTAGSGITSVPMLAIKKIAGERNILAHGYFDQNLFDGSYTLATSRKNDPPCYSAERINGLADEA